MRMIDTLCGTRSRATLPDLVRYTDVTEKPEVTE
jgi:hypothetical protein